jgi:hypothetical protein
VPPALSTVSHKTRRATRPTSLRNHTMLRVTLELCVRRRFLARQGIAAARKSGMQCGRV